MRVTDLKGKNVLITGAAGGIGRLLALAMVEQGARVLLWDIDESGLNKLADELPDNQASVYVCDLCRRDDIKTTAQKVLEQWQGVDILINNAGIVSGSTLLETSDDAIERTFQINTQALFWTTRAFLPGMIERKSGHIVTIASAAGLVGNSRLVDYCSSKFGAVGFGEALRMELKRLKSPVKTTLVCPYYINTGMFDGVKSPFPLLPILQPDYVVKRITRAIRTNRARLIMPWFVMTSFFMRLFPPAVFDKVLDVLGVTKSMDDFTGRNGNSSPVTKKA